MKRLLSLILVIILLVASTACSSTPLTLETTNVNPYVVDGNNLFAFDIFKALNKEDTKNSICISPFSISAALAMTYNGAENQTKTDMEKVLGFTGIDRALVNDSYKNLFNHLERIDKSIALNIGNSIWIREGEQIVKSFIKDNEDNFNATVDALDFADSGSADIINKWIRNETKGKIDKMVSSTISPDIVMFLINAIYFKGEWKDQFNPKNTRSADFTSYDRSIQVVDMMSRNDDYEYARGKDYKAIRLPYGKGKTSMNIILPDENTDINEFIFKMDHTDWYDIRDSLKETKDVQVKLPKFKMEYGIKSLNDSLKSLGMEIAYSEDADFSGIRQEDLFISDVLHKAVIEVDEEGSEAAAATVVVMQESAAPVEPITFIADRPFIFFITDDITGTILFMGKVLSI